MSYEKDSTYLGLANQALERYEPVLRDLPELKGPPVVTPNEWGDPQFILRVDPSASFERLQEIRALVRSEPVVPIVFKHPEEKQ